MKNILFSLALILLSLTATAEVFYRDFQEHRTITPSFAHKDVYFVCYRYQHSTPSRYFLNCPYKGWFSTKPWYSTEYYIYNVRPPFICYNHGTQHYKLFESRSKLLYWTRHNCSRWKQK